MTPEEVKTDEETTSETTTEEPAIEEVAVDEVAISSAGSDEVIVDIVEAGEVIVDRVNAGEVVVELDRQLRDYELVLVISPEVAEERFEAIIESVNQYVTGKEGIITSIDRWGKRNLAYPIKHHVDGNYVLTKFKMKPASGKELETNLRISTEVLRHLLIKLDN